MAFCASLVLSKRIVPWPLDLPVVSSRMSALMMLPH